MRYCINYSHTTDNNKYLASGWFRFVGSNNKYTPDLNDAYLGKERVEHNCRSYSEYKEFWIETEKTT